MRHKSILSKFRPLVIPLLILIIWEMSIRIFIAFGGISSKLIVIPQPALILQSIANSLVSHALIVSTGQTLMVTLLGFCLGIVGAVAVGAVLGFSSWAEAYLSPSLHFLRSLPVVLYVPVALVLLAPDFRIPVFLAAFVTMLYGAVPVMRAVRNYDPEKILLLRARKYSGIKMVIRFILPEIITALTTSISIAITLSLAVTVVTEMLFPGLGGLGAKIIYAKESSSYEQLWAYTCILGVCGFLLHTAILHLWRFAVPWAVEDIT